MASDYEAILEAKARAITDADPLAPSAEAPIGVGHRMVMERPNRLAEATELVRVANRVHGFAIVALYHPKKPENVGSVMRAALALGACSVQVFGRAGLRCGLQKLMRIQTDTASAWQHVPLIVSEELFRPVGAKIVAIEIAKGASALPLFRHPNSAVYAFGPEDGSLPEIDADERVAIPSRFCLNLSAAVNVTLYDRIAKEAIRVAAANHKDAKDGNP